MKNILKKSITWIGLSILMTILWIIGLMIANSIFPSNIMESSPDTASNGSDLWLLVTCFINTGAVLIFLYHARIGGLKLAVILFLIVFGIQFFMSQIETVWFNDSLKMPMNAIWMIVTGGAIMSILFSLSATWVTGKFKKSYTSIIKPQMSDLKSILKPVALLSIVIWPMVYFLAGYFIAWQFAEIREYYSGFTEMNPLHVMMKENILSGLYFFQIIRGILWVLIAALVFMYTTGSWVRKGLILGLLLTCLGCSQLLLPNPIMPKMVRMGHLLETSTSNFLWGFILSWFLSKYFSMENRRTQMNQIINQTV